MKSSFQHFYFSQVISFAVLSCAVSCTREELKSEDYDHNFRPGLTDGLIRLRDLRVTKTPIYGISGVNSDQGRIANLKESVSKIEAFLKIKAASQGVPVKIFSGYENVTIEPGVSFINRYMILNYEIVKPKTKLQKKIVQLLGEENPLRGFPDKEYYIVPNYDRNFLILYKVGPKEIIPYDELPLSVKLDKGMVAVPFIGYSIEYCRAEVIYENGEKTGQYRPLCEGISAKVAQYIRLREKNKREFTYLMKNIFPKDFFQGQWFYHRTIVRSPNRGQKVGHEGFQSANLVEFQQKSRKLSVLDASGYKLADSDKVRALFIPISRKDYEIERQAGNIDESFREVEKETRESHLTERPWLEVKFDELVEANQIIIKDIVGLLEIKGERTLENLYISNDYFSFNVEVAQEDNPGSYLIKYAFRKAFENKNYTEKQWFEKDSSLFFPSFSIIRKYHRSAEEHTQADFDRFFRITRFDPGKKEIKWHFSKQSSKEEWVKEIGLQAAELLDKAFQKAGENSKYKIRILLDEDDSDRKELGDIRYNILNMMVSEGSRGGILGLGPNVANPITGEIISATANVWVSHIINQYVHLIRRYIRFQVYPPAWQFPSYSAYGVTEFLRKKINKNCQGVNTFIQNNKGLSFHPSNSPLDDREIIKTCVKKISRENILSTTLHEMLHSLALRHIFSASADKDNYYKSFKEIQRLFGENVTLDIHWDKREKKAKPPQSSSLMDYPDLQYPTLSVPGKLDIAAIRFIYFDEVELKKEGTFLKVPAGADRDSDNPQKSILDAALAEGLTKEDIKFYRICGGKISLRGDINSDDPLCFKYDYGATPLEVVENTIHKAKDWMMAGRNRYDSKYPLSLPINLKNGIEQLESIYIKWRAYYVNPLLEKNRKNLFDYSFQVEKNIEDYKNLIEKEAKQNSEFKEYYDVREPLFNFLKEIAFLPVKHCVYRQVDGSYKAVALENIEQEIFSLSSKKDIFINCQSPVVQDWANKHIKGTLVTEIGLFGKNRKYLFKDNDNDTIDEQSVFSSFFEYYVNRKIKARAFFWSLLMRLLSLIVLEPDFAKSYYSEISDYILEGMDLNPYIDKKALLLDIHSDELNIPRVLSFKVDTETAYQIGENIEQVYTLREKILNRIVGYYKQNQISGQDISDFNYFSMGLRDLHEEAKALDVNPNLYKEDRPFFHASYQAYNKIKQRRDNLPFKDFMEILQSDNSKDAVQALLQTYHKIKQKKDSLSFEEFIQIHPAVLSLKATAQPGIVYIPQEENSLKARLFQKTNSYLTCIEIMGDFCPDKAEKEAFINIVLSNL